MLANPMASVTLIVLILTVWSNPCALVELCLLDDRRLWLNIQLRWMVVIYSRTS